ncbi:MAG: hypothetical protein ACR2MB_04125 [Acidimicrobiales bacterium]
MHRLRDLDRAGRLVALLVLVALAAPFVASVVHAERLGWRPSNDDALIALRVKDVVALDPPTTGQPSTADHYDAGDPPRHPGPIEFYLLAVPTSLLGFDLGMVVGAGLFTFAGVAIAVWVAFRRGGPGIGLGAAVVCSGIAWSEGQAVLTDAISSNVGGIPLLALAALAWALVDGDVRLVPLAAFVFAFVCQAHLAIVGVAVGTAAWAAVGIGLFLLAWRRGRRHAHPAPSRPPHDGSGSEGVDAPPVTAARERWWPWLAGGLAVTLVAWAPVFWDQFFGSGNLSRIVSFAQSSDRPRLGLRSGATQALRALGMPPLLLRTDVMGGEIKAALAPTSVVVSLLVVASLVAIAVIRWRSCRAHAALAATTLVVAAVGAWNGANVPDSLESFRINFYRWTFVASAGATASLLWVVGAVLTAKRPHPTAPSRMVVASVGVVALVAVSVAAIQSSGPRQRRDEQIFALEDQISRRALDAATGQHRVLLVVRGSSATLATGPALAFRLVDGGHDLRVLPAMKDGYGRHRVIGRGEQVDTVLELDTFTGPPPIVAAGKRVVRLDVNAKARRLIGSLSARLRGQALVRSPRYRQVLERAGMPVGTPAASFLIEAMTHLDDDPVATLRNGLVLHLLIDGYLTSPRLPEADLKRLAAIKLTTSWGEDTFELRELTPAQAQEAYGIDLG